MSTRENYQKEMDKLIEHLNGNGEAPLLLLHSCCAPCSSYVIEYLSQYFKISVFYYNPNIFPESEYEFRKKEQKRLIAEMPTVNKVEFIDADYDSKSYYDVCKGHENDPEGGERCALCFKLRLEKTAQLAAKNKFDFFATTLTVSPLKNADVINDIGAGLAQKYGTEYLKSDFKKRNGYKRTIELSKEYSLYRQNYCGCVFSRPKEN